MIDGLPRDLTHCALVPDGACDPAYLSLENVSGIPADRCRWSVGLTRVRSAFAGQRGGDSVAEVKVGKNESLDSALRRFKRQCRITGVLSDARRHERYEKPSVRRKRSPIMLAGAQLGAADRQLCFYHCQTGVQ